MKWMPQADGASPVLMVRSLPRGTTDQEMVKWVEGFRYQPRDANGAVNGPVRQASCVKALVLHDRMLGFVQFNDIWAARAVMAQFVRDPPSIVLNRADGCYPLNLVYSDKPEIKAQNRGRAAPPPQPVYTNSRLLLVVLKELSQMVTIDELFWVFTQISKVEKISSFTKDNKNQIVVQFETAQGATAAMDYFNGKYIPAPGGDPNATPLCFLAIVPSKLSQLTFRNQDGRNRDYTEVNRLVSALTLCMCPTKQAAAQEWANICAVSNMNNRSQLTDFIWGTHRWGSGWLVPAQPAEYQGKVPPAPASDGSSSQGQLGECMHISGLPTDDSLTADHLWNLCGMYGCVRAVKMLFKYRGCAVVQFTTSDGCSKAIEHLHGLEFKGRTWDAKLSRQPNATHWNGTSDDLQKRMVSHSDGRVAPPQCIEGATYPSKHLVMWDVPDTKSEDYLMELAAKVGGTRPDLVVKQGSTATLQYSSLNYSVVAAIALNGFKDGEWVCKARFSSDALAPPAASFFRMSSNNSAAAQKEASASSEAAESEPDTTNVQVQLGQLELRDEVAETNEDDELLAAISQPSTPFSPGSDSAEGTQFKGKTKKNKPPRPPGLARGPPATNSPNLGPATPEAPQPELSPGLLMMITDTAPQTAFCKATEDDASPWNSGTPAACSEPEGFFMSNRE